MTTEADVTPTAAPLPPADGAALFRWMLTMRTLEERAMTLYRQGKVPGSFYDGYGQEAISVGATGALSLRDRICPLHRDLGAHVVRGTELDRIVGQYLGRAGGVTSGRDANVHFGDRERGTLGMVSMLGSMVCVAGGLALASKLRGDGRCALTFIGDGGTSTGAFHEALNFAAVHVLPLIVVVENNGYAYSTPTDRQFAIEPGNRAAAYGVAGARVDGNDVEAVFAAVRQARERALAGEGTTLIEAVTMRMHGHAAHDDMSYVPPERLEQWREKDPIAIQEARVPAAEEIRAEVAAAVDAAVEVALEMPMPSAAEALTAFSDGAPVPLGDGAER